MLPRENMKQRCLLQTQVRPGTHVLGSVSVVPAKQADSAPGIEDLTDSVSTPPVIATAEPRLLLYTRSPESTATKTT